MTREIAVHAVSSLTPAGSIHRLGRPSSNVLTLALFAALGAALVGCRGASPTSPMHLSDRAAAVTRDHDTDGSRAEVFEAAGDIRGAVEAYRTALGTLNPNQPGSFGSGRREINWDAVPAAFTNVDNFPADFFNQPAVGRARGAVFSTRGAGFRVSDNNFKDVNPSYANEFNFFSPVRTFMSVGNPLSAVDFFVPGTTTPAGVTGFGVVFSDVDHRGSARIRVLDASGHELGTYMAPADPGGLSFVGVQFRNAIVARVEIRSGDAALGPDSFDTRSGHHGPTRDLVIMDDFLYGEPVVIQNDGDDVRSLAAVR